MERADDNSTELLHGAAPGKSTVTDNVAAAASSQVMTSATPCGVRARWAPGRVCGAWSESVVQSPDETRPPTTRYMSSQRHNVAGGSRDSLVVRTLRCGRSNPGSNPGHGTVGLVLVCSRRLQSILRACFLRLFTLQINTFALEAIDATDFVTFASV